MVLGEDDATSWAFTGIVELLKLAVRTQHVKKHAANDPKVNFSLLIRSLVRIEINQSLDTRVTLRRIHTPPEMTGYCPCVRTKPILVE